VGGTVGGGGPRKAALTVRKEAKQESR